MAREIGNLKLTCPPFFSQGRLESLADWMRFEHPTQWDRARSPQIARAPCPIARSDRASLLRRPVASASPGSNVASRMSGRQKLLSLELPKVARQANLCVDFAGFCGVWADSGHGYAAAPTVALPSSQGFVALPRHLAIESQPEAAKSLRGEGESRHASKAR